MDRQKIGMIFGGAAVLAALLTWVLYANTVAPRKDKMASIVAASRDMPAGTRVGKSDVHSLEPEDLAALTMEASLMTKVPLAGTNYRPWENGGKARGGKKCV